MTTATAATFLDGLKLAADRAAAAETEFRRGVAQRIAGFERERSFAYRRLNLMRKLLGAIGDAKSEEEALPQAAAMLRDALGWSSDSEARQAVLDRFLPVTRALLRSLGVDSTDEAETSPADALADFEAWYAETHPGPFWALFDQYMPETPLVDF